MHLIAPLVSGVTGASNGTAEIYRRGTSTRATYYTDFEATASVSSGIDVLLDSSGGAVVYVNELVHVIVKSSSGSTVRTFVAGDAAAAIEYQGQGFSGTNYTSGAAGTGSGYPTTLQTILDRWYASAGADDFEVLVNGAAATVQSAVGGLSGLVFNVMSPVYGAVGDGVTDDGTAIDAAIAAATANGGGVYFPPGTYRRTTKMTLPAKVSLLGAGPNASIITMDHPTNTLLQTAGLTTYEYQFVAGLRLTASQANSGNVLSLPNGSKIVFENCHVGGANCDGILLLASTSTTTLYKATDCVFEIGSLNAAAVSHAGSVMRATYRGCRFIVPAGAGYTPTPDAVVSANNIDMVDCLFDASAITAGGFTYFLASSTTTAASLQGCRFLAPAGTAIATAIVLGTYTSTAVFYEAGNIFGTDVIAYSYLVNDSSEGADVQLVSRIGRVKRVSTNSAAYVAETNQYGTIIITRSSTATMAFRAIMPPDGAVGSVIVHQTGGTAINGPNDEATASDGFKSGVAGISMAAGEARHWFYRAAVVDNVLCLFTMPPAPGATTP